MIKLAINGYYGRMGQTVAKVAQNDEEIKEVVGIDKIKKEEEINTVTEVQDLKEKPDVIIDFSIPEATFKILEYAKQNKVPVVIATTGFTKEEEKKIK